MPKIEVTEHLLFLWDCFLSARDNGGKVDTKAVADLHGLSTGAAGMRLHRLKHTIDQVKKQLAENNDGNANESDEVATPKSKAKAKKPENESDEVATPKSKAEAKKPENEKPSTPKRKRDQVTKDEAGEEDFEDTVEQAGKKIKAEEDHDDEGI